MTLSDIENKLFNLPTVMDIDDEILLIKGLMKIAPETLVKHQMTVLKIIHQLELAHTDNGFMLLSDDNEAIFRDFSIWLVDLQQKYHVDINNNTIENFMLTMADVKKRMP